MTMTSGSLGQGWFDVSTVAEAVWAIQEPRQAEEVYSYLIEGRDRAVLIDTGTGAGDIAALARELTNRPISVINSHAHWDHVGGNWQFADIAIHRLEAERLPLGVPNTRLFREFGPDSVKGHLPQGFDRETFAIPPSRATTLLSGGERIDLGGRVLDVIHAPGHSPGGIVLLDAERGLLFSTDVAYPAALYAFGPDSDWDRYKSSMRALAELAPSLVSVHGSHTYHTMMPSTLGAMSAAFADIDAGRAPDDAGPELSTYHFDGFSVLRPSMLNEERGAV
jgi:glyoxylase-like metal-dependent hydrolase (beta-lactamase superfamily II)